MPQMYMYPFRFLEWENVMTCLRVPGLTLTFVMGVTAFTLAGSAEAACTTCITLTQAEWQCLQARLDRYQGEPVDPVLASVLGCEQPKAAAPISTRQDPPIWPNKSPGGDNEAARKVFYLTKAQIGCIRGAINDLIASSGDGLIEFDPVSRCPATAH